MSKWIHLFKDAPVLALARGEPAKGGWILVAEQIGVSPPALYRELARRRR
ncbi:hypothetical protein GCM10011498_13350 [Amylibacter cionae]|uniref:Uncharacterized protein n=1 Tax=Neptunicoccus cionae TaxID=2035344 RepID=A0A916QVP3_9RHOB|nr:hypothetical protein GCM10011498_13350 [Amylibacter cionae]